MGVRKGCCGRLVVGEGMGRGSDNLGYLDGCWILILGVEGKGYLLGVEGDKEKGYC
jgi:hypothetical protein